MFLLQVRNHPLYHLIKAQVQKKMGHPDESVSTMQAAMNLPGVKNPGMQTYFTRHCEQTHSCQCSKQFRKSCELLSKQLVQEVILIILTSSINYPSDTGCRVVK